MRLLTGALATLVVVVGYDFFTATTFIGDDHLFLTFARAVANPLVTFVRDCHGGEYYRPVPMILWWLLARAGTHVRVFALCALTLHAAAAWLTGRLGRALGWDRAGALTAAAVFFAAPAEREAALWFSASTDLLATVATLGALLCLVRRTRAAYGWSLLLAAIAYCSKETALVLPLLALVILRATSGAHDRRARGLARALAPHVALALLYLAARFAVLRGWGGAGDDRAPAWGRALQLGSGLVHALVGDRLLPELVLVPLGLATLLWSIAAVRRDRPARPALLFIVVALVPLPAAGWVIGARYFYLPAVGLALLLGRRLAARGAPLSVAAILALVAIGSAQAVERRAEIAAYDARLAAATAAVAAGRAQGQRLFHVRAGLKDLDLALKGQPALRAGVDDFLVLGDVPASFVLVPPALAPRISFLRASPPLPPSGAYHFGARTVVGLARRDESPDLDEVIARLPELRFLELVETSTGITWHDITTAKRP